MGWEKNQGGWEDIVYYFPAEIRSVFNCRTNTSGCRRPCDLAGYVWFVLRVWCVLFTNGLWGCLLVRSMLTGEGLHWQLSCPGLPGSQVWVAEDAFLSGAQHYKINAVLPNVVLGKEYLNLTAKVWLKTPLISSIKEKQTMTNIHVWRISSLLRGVSISRHLTKVK